MSDRFAKLRYELSLYPWAWRTALFDEDAYFRWHARFLLLALHFSLIVAALSGYRFITLVARHFR
jgi:hypothetical protein